MTKSFSSINKAYVAGFLDADGSIYARAKPNPTYRYGFQIALYIVFFQSAKDRENFEKVCALIRYGRMRERKDGILEYVVNRIDDVKELLMCVRPYVVMKKQQVDLMLRIIDLKTGVVSRNDFESLLHLIDSYRELNYSKKRKVRVLTP